MATGRSRARRSASPWTKYTAGAMLVMLAIAGPACASIETAAEPRRGAAAAWCAAGALVRRGRRAQPVRDRRPLDCARADRGQSGTRGRRRQARAATRSGLDLLPRTLTWGLGWLPAAGGGGGRGAGALARLAPRAPARRVPACSCSLFLGGTRRASSAAGCCPPIPRCASSPATPRCGRWRAAGRWARGGGRRSWWPRACCWRCRDCGPACASTPCSAAPTRARSRASGSSATCRRAPASWSSPPCSRGTSCAWASPAELPALPVKPPFQAYEKHLQPRQARGLPGGRLLLGPGGSYQRDRGLNAGFRQARAYYRALAAAALDRRGVLSLPLGAKPVHFNFDLSFDYLPRAYMRPGPLLEIHRLNGCR